MNAQKKNNHRTAVLRRNAKASEDNTLIKTLKASLWGLVITVAVSFLLLLIGTAVAYSTSDPSSLIDPISYVSLYMASFFGGFACAKLNRRAPYLSSAMTSGAFILLGVLVSLIVPYSEHSLDSAWVGLTLRLLTLLVFFIGTLIGLKQGGAPKKRPQKRR